MSDVIGGEVVARLLAAEGVDTVFGIVDGTYLGLLAGLERHGIRLVSPRHETSAAHMAGAYARLTGRLGVCIASNGPGVANVLPGVAVEQGEGNRVLLVTSSRRTGLTGPLRPGTYQGFEQTAVTAPMTKWSRAVPAFDRLVELTTAALAASFRGRPGVVHLDVPEDVLNGAFPAPRSVPDHPAAWRRTAPVPPPPEGLAEAVALLRSAERPLVHAGSGVIHAGASSALAELAEALAAPVTTSWGARAALPDDHPFHLPVPTMDAVDEARRTADVILVLGSRLGETDWWGKAPYWGRPGEQRIIRVDVDEAALGLNRPADLPLQADLAAFLPVLVAALADTPPEAAVLAARRDRMAGLRERRDAVRAELDVALENDAAPLHSSRVPGACREAFADDAVFVFDGGNAAVWATFFTAIRRPNTVLSTWKFGMLGAGVAQALGAKAARPDAPVCCILGDGAMGFHLQEIETAVRSELPVVWVVMVDRQWGMVKLTQQLALSPLRQVMGGEAEGTINTDLGDIGYDAIARAMGAHGERVSAPDDLPGALKRAQASGRPAVVHVDVDPMMHLFAPGLQQFKAMHQEPEG